MTWGVGKGVSAGAWLAVAGLSSGCGGGLQPVELDVPSRACRESDHRKNIITEISSRSELHPLERLLRMAVFSTIYLHIYTYNHYLETNAKIID
jgi:hypothetical protein